VRLALTGHGAPGIEFARNEFTGAVGDSVTVLPIVVAVAVLTDLSLGMMLVWFGVFQIVWGLYYGVPISVEPMKALAALLLAGTITTGEFLLAGVILAVVLVAIAATGTLDRVRTYIGEPVVRGVQFGVALVLLETGLSLGLADRWLAGLAVAVALAVIATGSWNLSAFVVLVVGTGVALLETGVPAPAVPAVTGVGAMWPPPVTLGTVEATVGQLAMTVGNAALAASVLLADYFDREVSPDELAASMGVTNLVALPFGAMPMCHGSGGIAGKYAFGARTAGANVILGVGYVGVALTAVGLVAAYPTAMLGVILVLVALQLGWTGLKETDRPLLIVVIGAVGLVVNLAAAFLAGVVVWQVLTRRREGRTGMSEDD
jgi:MFS superfamily sulfate permease-like transporter